MVGNIFLILGLDPKASWSEVESAFKKLMKVLSTTSSANNQEMKQRMEEASRRLQEAYEHYKRCKIDEAQTPHVAKSKNHELEEETKTTSCHPKLGQLLVSAGIASLSELDAVLEIQRNTNNEHIPLGELMVAAGYISKSQLSYYLHQQELIQLPIDHPERWGQRLIELGLINDDQLKVALLDQQSTNCTLREAFINRGWLTTEELDRIF